MGFATPSVVARPYSLILPKKTSLWAAPAMEKQDEREQKTPRDPGQTHHFSGADQRLPHLPQKRTRCPEGSECGRRAMRGAAR